MGALAQSFKQHAMALIYTSFTEAAFMQHANMCRDAYDQFPKAKQCLDRILQHKAKICRTYTGRCFFRKMLLAYFVAGRVFTCNHVASQRGESVNSVLK